MSERRHAPEVLLTEAASLFYLLGGIAPKHLVVVGGLVPPLLLPESPQPHRGSADIDLVLSVAITKGETAEYYESLEESIRPYFEPAGSGFRWRKRKGAPGISLLVDFLGPEAEATTLEDGTLLPEDATAAANTGEVLRPLPLAAARLVDADAETRVVEGVPLVFDPGVRADVKVRHAGPVGLLASKANAFETRSDSKDGYDVSWWCINGGEDPAAVARLVTERPAYRDPDFAEALAILRSAFRERDFPGPSGYAQEMNPTAGPGDEAYERDRNRAFLTVSGVLEKLLAELWQPDEVS